MDSADETSSIAPGVTEQDADLRRASARLPHLPAGGDAHDAAHRCTLRPRPPDSPNRGRDARVAWRAPERGGRGERAEHDPPRQDTGSSVTATLPAHVGP